MRAQDDDKLTEDRGMPGGGLTLSLIRKVSSDMLALKPYRGKPAVRNFRGGDGNVGIIRSPVRAIALLDQDSGAYHEKTKGTRICAGGAFAGPKGPLRGFIRANPCPFFGVLITCTIFVVE